MQNRHEGGTEMYRFKLLIPIVALILSASANATVFSFNTDPFAGSTALTTPGRQIVAGENFIYFNIATDIFSLESTAFGVGSQVQFANNVVANLPPTGVNVVVLQTFDDDANSGTAFAAGNAANLIANQITTAGPGFFIYFNQGLDLPRLVFSTDLSDNTADLKVLFRMTNLTGQGGRDAMPTFTASNFEFTTVPEPSSVLIMTAGIFFASCYAWLRRRARS
jgi:hypothetical protein